nr:MAG TPA: hypothetical protein [Caudoviricetes sp.]
MHRSPRRSRIKTYTPESPSGRAAGITLLYELPMRFPLDPSVEKARCGAYRRQPHTQLEKAQFRTLAVQATTSVLKSAL